MRFSDHRVTVTKRQPDRAAELNLYEGYPTPVPPTPRRIAPVDRDPLTLAPTHNRASRRALGVYRRHQHGRRWRSLQTALKSLRLAPWQIVAADVVEDTAA